MTNAEKAEQLCAWFKGREIQPLQYGNHYMVRNPALYAETARETMKHAEKGSNAFKAAYMRLWRLKKHLEEHYEINR